jgi:hypothetical protein
LDIVRIDYQNGLYWDDINIVSIRNQFGTDTLPVLRLINVTSQAKRLRKRRRGPARRGMATSFWSAPQR